MTACRVSLSVGLAAILLAAIPPPRDPRSWQQRLPEGRWQVWPGPLLLVAVTAAAVVACEVGWRQLTSSQAQMFLRSVMLKLHYADLRMVVRRQLRLKKRSQQRRVPRTPEAQPANPTPLAAESLPWENVNGSAGAIRRPRPATGPPGSGSGSGVIFCQSTHLHSLPETYSAL